jgi:hypothetical protein
LQWGESESLGTQAASRLNVSGLDDWWQNGALVE